MINFTASDWIEFFESDVLSGETVFDRFESLFAYAEEKTGVPVKNSMKIAVTLDLMCYGVFPTHRVGFALVRLRLDVERLEKGE